MKPTKTRRRRPGRGTLVIISSMLILSAMLRMGSDAGLLMALEPSVPGEPKTGSNISPAADCTPPQDIAEILKAFEKREERLVAREAALKERLQDISVADRAIKTRLTALQTAEEKLSKTIALADTAAENDLARLISVYESMKPKQAAALFEEMDPDFAAGFLGRMKPEAAAGIMAGLTANTAYTISVVMAGRNASVPTE